MRLPLDRPGFELTAILTLLEKGLSNRDRLHANPIGMKVQDHSPVMADALGRGVEHRLSTAGAPKYVRHANARVRLPTTYCLP